jgi:predicted DNA-binding ribbon-helix-helix protein
VTQSRLINRNITALRGRTSMRLEPELWDALEEICQRENVSTGEMVKRVEERGHPGGRTSAVRVFILTYFRNAATETGHRLAGHGDADGVPPPPAAPWAPGSQGAPAQPSREPASASWDASAAFAEASRPV